MDPADERDERSETAAATPMATVEPTSTTASLAHPVIVLVAIGDALVVGGSFLTWVVSGTATRDSFATVRAAQHIGLVGMRFWETVLSIWFVTPLLGALVLVGIAFERRSLVPVVGIPLGLLAALFGSLVLLAPVERGIGPLVVTIGGLLLLVGSGLAWRRSRR